MTTNTKPEYVTDVEHVMGCWKQHDRTALYLEREKRETQPPYFYEDDDGERIASGGKWVFEELLRPIRLRCSGCDASRYVAIDKYEDLVGLTPKTCPRGYVDGHYTNYDGKPCEYCGYAGKGGAQ